MSGPSPGAMNRSNALGSSDAPIPTTETVRPPLGVSKISSRERQLAHVTLPVATRSLTRTVTIEAASPVFCPARCDFAGSAEHRDDNDLDLLCCADDLDLRRCAIVMVPLRANSTPPHPISCRRKELAGIAVQFAVEAVGGRILFRGCS